MINNVKANRAVGVWIVGARGDIATTLMVGTLALRKGLTSNAGLVSTTPPFNELELLSFDNLKFGGIDIKSQFLPQVAEEVYRNSKTFSRETLDAVSPELTSIDNDIVSNPDFAWNPLALSEKLPELPGLISQIQKNISEFRNRHTLDHVVVVDLASAEPVPPELHIQESLSYKRLNHFRFLLEDDRKDLITPSMIYAYAAFMEHCSYINFTPNTGASIGALQELAESQCLPYYGNDGKTGETLIKTALAPMFAYRNLQIMSWEGINILGNNDGKTLDNPDNRANKIRNKEGVLEQMLGYPVHSGVNINYVPSLGDWKTAWDLIHFKGFMDVKMTMQFTWQGCDSILAAPLVLDMIRFSEFAARHNESGQMRHLAAFFKNPLAVSEMALYPQFEMLLSYTWKHLSRQKESKINKI